MNAERIAEIEAVVGKLAVYATIGSVELLELCRLARLGLRVEGAGRGIVLPWNIGEPVAFIAAPFDMRCGTRVALVEVD